VNIKIEGSRFNVKNVVTSTKYALLQNALQLIVSKDIIKVVHNLCIEKQRSFLGMKQRLQELLVKKEHKELEHWQAKLMFDDQQAIHAQVIILFEKVKDDFDVAQLSMQGFFKLVFVHIMCLSSLLMAKCNYTKLLRFQIYYINFILKRRVLCK
jgi:hypothetical protein